MVIYICHILSTWKVAIWVFERWKSVRRRLLRSVFHTHWNSTQLHAFTKFGILISSFLFRAGKLYISSLVIIMFFLYHISQEKHVHSQNWSLSLPSNRTEQCFAAHVLQSCQHYGTILLFILLFIYYNFANITTILLNNNIMGGVSITVENYCWQLWAMWAVKYCSIPHATIL